MEEKKILALDWGTSKIGIAMADNEIRIAFAYGTVDNDKNFVVNLKKIVQKERIEIVVLGKLGHVGNAKKSFNIDEIGSQLEKSLGIQVVFQEEMFSTKMAENNLKERGARKIKQIDNEEAARIILQSWLERKV